MINKSFRVKNSELLIKENWFTKRFGNKQYIKSLFKIFLPAVLQSLISIIVLYVDNFSLAILIDNKVEANAAKNALGLANPVINLLIFITIGWIGGITIMMSQYFGNKDTTMTKKTTAFRLWTILLIIIPFVIITAVFPGKLIEISSKVYGGLDYELARLYLFVTSFTFFPYVIATSLSFSLQETNRAHISFIAALVGLATNIVLDPIIIIFSKSVYQAVELVALSTGIARIIQTIFIIIYILAKNDKYINFFKEWKIKKHDAYLIVKKGLPIFINETLFGMASMVLMICLLSFNENIHNATTNLVILIEITNVIWPGVGSASAVLVGSELGNGDTNQAKRNASKLMHWGVVFSFIICLIVFILSLFINPILSPAATTEMNQLAQYLEWAMLPIIASQGVFSVAYYSIKSGGTRMVLLIDCVVMIVWAIGMSIITFTGIAKNWHPVLFIVCLEFNQIIKMIISLFIYRHYNWARVLTKNNVK